MHEGYKLALKLEEEEKYEEALEKLEILYLEKQGPFDIKNDMGRINNKIRKFADALGCFESVLPMDESNSEYLFGKGISLIGLNKFDVALDIFDKLTDLDNGNANFWYYQSLLSKALGDSDAKAYFDNFLQLDNDDFRNIRLFYKFGILFDEIEHEFRGFSNLEVLTEFKDELMSLNLDDTQYSELIRIVPLQDLFYKIAELKKSKFEVDTEEIIRREFKKQGLIDEEIHDLFLIDTFDELKKQIIELCDENPFSDLENNSNFVPVKSASRYNPGAKYIIKYEYLRLFVQGNFYLDYDEPEKAIEAYNEGLEYAPDNLSLNFVKCCAIYKLGCDNDE